MKRLVSITFFLVIFAVKSYTQPFNLTATIPYNNSYASGTYQVFRSYWTNNVTLNNLRKPCSCGYAQKLAVAGDDLQSSPFSLGFLILTLKKKMPSKEK